MSSSELHTLQRAFAAAGGKWSTFVMWAKNTFTLGRADYQRQYEPILYGWKEGSDHYWCGARDQGDVWFVNKPVKNDLHPTMKPVALVERAVRNSSKTRDIVLDAFGGSGSTLIACEKTRRQARLIELDPKYVDTSSCVGRSSAVAPRPWTTTGGATTISPRSARQLKAFAPIADVPASARVGNTGCLHDYDGERTVGAQLTLIAACSQPRRFGLGPAIGAVPVLAQKSIVWRIISVAMAVCWRCSSAVQRPRMRPPSCWRRSARNSSKGSALGFLYVPVQGLNVRYGAAFRRARRRSPERSSGSTPCTCVRTFLYGLMLPELEQEPAAEQHRGTPGQEADVPEDPLLARHCLVDMVDAEQVMVDGPFDQVEQTEADQERAGEQLGRPPDVPATGRRPPQNYQPHHDEDVRGRVEKAVP